MRYFIIISLFILSSFLQLNGQTHKQYTAVAQNKNTTTADSVSSIKKHPADLLYEQNWSTTNIAYPFVRLKARKDTLEIHLPPAKSTFTPPVTGKVISAFMTLRRPNHTGTDIKLNLGDTVRCAFDGQVRLARRFSGYGLMVLVRHSNGLETLYAHLSKISVVQNQFIKAGETIGQGGHSGRATTDHLHFETRILGEPFDAEKLIDFKQGTLRCNTFYFNKSRIEYHRDDFKTKSPADYIASDNAITYSVKKGDTLSAIALQFGTSIRSICMLNKISPQDVLQIGTLLVIKP